MLVVHDSGNLLLAYKMPDVYLELFEIAVREDRALASVQSKELGFDYAEVGAALLEKWQLPEPIIEPIKHHTNKLTQTPVDRVADASIVHTASVISRASMWREEGDEPVPEFHEVAMATVGIDDDLINECMNEADDALVEALGLLLPNAPKARQKASAA